MRKQFVVIDLQDELVGDWVVKRNIDGQDKPDFKLETGLSLKPASRVKVLELFYCTLFEMRQHVSQI
jgi:hypothetical protein